jgi:hypothetical protein
MSKITELASGPINGTNSLTVELVEADETPAVVIIRWPVKPTVLGPRRYAEAAAAAMKALASASTELAAIKARRRLKPASTSLG